MVLVVSVSRVVEYRTVGMIELNVAFHLRALRTWPENVVLGGYLAVRLLVRYVAQAQLDMAEKIIARKPVLVEHLEQQAVLQGLYAEKELLVLP